MRDTYNHILVEYADHKLLMYDKFIDIHLGFILYLASKILKQIMIHIKP